MYFGAPISPRPCPPSPHPEYNNPRPRPSHRGYNPNTSLHNNSANTSLGSFNDSYSEESPISSPQRNFTIQNMALSISPRSPRKTISKPNDIFNRAYYKRHKTNRRTDENGSNPYFPVQPLTDAKIDQIKAILKMNYTENTDKSNTKPSEISVMEDHIIDDLLSKIENRLQGIAPTYFYPNGSAIPSTPAASTNALSNYKLSSKGSELSSPKSPRKLPANFNTSCHDFLKYQPLQFGSDLKQKKKLRISRSPSADIEKYITIDKDGNDDLDRKIIELKGKLTKIAELIKARNSSI